MYGEYVIGKDTYQEGDDYDILDKWLIKKLNYVKGDIVLLKPLI